MPASSADIPPAQTMPRGLRYGTEILFRTGRGACFALRTAQEDGLRASGPFRAPNGSFDGLKASRRLACAYRQIKYTSAGMQEGAAIPFLSLSKKAGVAGLFRQDTFPLRLGRGRGNVQGNLAAKGTSCSCARSARPEHDSGSGLQPLLAAYTPPLRISFGGLRPSNPP